MYEFCQNATQCCKNVQENTNSVILIQFKFFHRELEKWNWFSEHSNSYYNYSNWLVAPIKVRPLMCQATFRNSSSSFSQAKWKTERLEAYIRISIK